MNRRSFLAALAAAPIAAVAWARQAAPLDPSLFGLQAADCVNDATYGPWHGLSRTNVPRINPGNVYGRVTFSRAQIEASRFQSGAWSRIRMGAS